MRKIYFIIFILVSSQLRAEDNLVLAMTEDLFTSDLPIVLSASRLAQPLSEAPVAMTVIDREMIVASGARNIPELMRLVPGFQVGYYDGNSPIVAYHGHSGEYNTRLQVLIDGRSVYEPALNAVPWSDLEVTLDDIERIEIIRGPNASTYGNNSYFAVISITTRHAIESQGQYVHIRTGSHDTNNVTYTFGDHAASMDYRFTLNTTNDNGTDLLRDETEADSISYRFDWQLSGNDRLMYQGGHKKSKLGDHEFVGDENPVTGHTIETKTSFQLIKWEHSPESNNSMSLQYYYNKRNYTEISPPTIYPDVNALLISLGYDPFVYTGTLEIISERHDLEFNNIIQARDNLRVVWGSSIREDKAGGYLDDGNLFGAEPTQTIKLYRGYAHGEWEFLPDWLLNTGYMVEYNELSGNDRSPRVALIHHINDNHTIRISKSKATRTPTLWEEDGELVYRHNLTSNNGGPPSGLGGFTELISTEWLMLGGLDSEKITHTEVGYIGQFIKNKLTIDLTVFQEKTDQLIAETDIPTPAPLPTQYDLSYPGETFNFINQLSSKISGYETGIEYEPNKAVRVYLFYSHINIESQATSLGEDIINSAPEDSGGIMLTRHWNNNIDSSLMYYRYENFDWLDHTGNDSADAYSKLDLRISKTWHMGEEKIELACTGQNLLGNFYDYNKTTYNGTTQTIDNYGSLQDRRIYIDLALRFH